MLRDSREGIPLNKAEFYGMDAKLSAAIQSGQHMYQALQSTGVEIAVSTAYKYADKGYFSFTSLDLPRKVKFKSRKKKRMPYVPPAVKKGRTYADFLQYIETHEITNWVEMDTVIGRQGGKVILTLLFTICNFMVVILLDSKSALAVSQEFRHLREKFAAAQTPFAQLFPHMNSTARKQYNGKTPYQLFCLYYGKEMADLLEIREVPADKVIQRKRLLKLLNVTG